MSYPGGKSMSGIYQYLINQIPPHRVFIETHLGGGAIMRNKKLADTNIGVDIDPLILSQWGDSDKITLVQSDAVEYLNKYEFLGDEFIYVDPPYLMSTRKAKRKIYNYEYAENQHIQLLDVLQKLECNIMISGYFSDLYNQELKNWRRVEFKSRNRSGNTTTEYLWMNYSEVDELHDYQYLGSSFRERDRIKKRNLRWQQKISNLPTLEKNALLQCLNTY